jgi:hypothetical protein
MVINFVGWAKFVFCVGCGWGRSLCCTWVEFFRIGV